MNTSFEHLIDDKILNSSSLSGGCIGSSMKVDGEKRSYFVKHYSSKGVAACEAHGLAELAKADAIRVPSVINHDDHYLILELITPASRVANFQSLLGKKLARLHKKSANSFGFIEDNYIGSTPQRNSFKEDWTIFYLENRLDYQVDLTKDRDIRKIYTALRDKLPELFKTSIEAPAFIHGDLWGGNVMCDEKGEPVIIDPAVCYAHRELELGMTKLFGGFTAEFYRAYDEEFPLKSGWKERVDIYKLYHVLNHFNLFGSSYKQEAISIMRSYT